MGEGDFANFREEGISGGETMEQALIRECKEELCLDVKPVNLVLARDYIAKNHNTTLAEPRFHQAELMFYCQVADFSCLGQGEEPDGENQQIKWIALDDLQKSDFMPKAIIPYLKDIENMKQTIVLGDVS